MNQHEPIRDLVAYLSRLIVTHRRLAGQPFRVLLWQRRFVCGTFRPGVQSAALTVARANGKTALVAGIAAATLDGPLTVPRGETVMVASSFEQARIAFEHVSWATRSGTRATGALGHGATSPD